MNKEKTDGKRKIKVNPGDDVRLIGVKIYNGSKYRFYAKTIFTPGEPQPPAAGLNETPEVFKLVAQGLGCYSYMWVTYEFFNAVSEEDATVRERLYDSMFIELINLILKFRADNKPTKTAGNE